MKRLIACALVLFVLLAATLSVAQQNASSQYTVQKGDNLWQLAGDKLKDPMLWQRIYKQNPFLQEPGRRFENDGIIYVLIKPGEKLVGLEELGIIPSFAPIEKLTTPAEVVHQVAYEIPSWLWWLLVFLAAVATYAFLRSHENAKARRRAEDARLHQEAQMSYDAAEQETLRQAAEEQTRRETERRREPEQLGTPVVAGGIQPTETERLQNFFQEQAISNYLNRHPELSGNRTSVYPTLVGQIEHGMLSGEGQVCDLNGTWHDSLIDPPGRPGYQARFRYPDGTEELMQAYQACMNPVRYGQGMRGFTFVPDPSPAVAEQPQTQPANTPETPAPVEQTDGMVKLELRKPTDKQGALVRLTGVDETEDLTCEIEKTGIITLRFHPKYQ